MIQLIFSLIIFSTLLNGCLTTGTPAITPSKQPNTILPSASVITTCTYQYDGGYALPDPNCTPGSIDPNVTQENIDQTICVTGYTAKVRPPESFTEPLKIQGMREYNSGGSVSDIEFDHLISLELGGSPRDKRNLWPEPTKSPNLKDNVERRLRSLICSNQMPLATAQEMIAKNWVQTGRSIGINLP